MAESSENASVRTNDANGRVLAKRRVPSLAPPPATSSASPDPYILLGLRPERVEDLLELGALQPAEAEARLRARAAAISEAYRAAAAATHPDRARGRRATAAAAGADSAALSASSSSDEARFAAVAAAAHLLRDLASTLRYHAALCADGDAERVRRLLGLLRWHEALRERAACEVLVAERRQQMLRRDDGIVVLLALYGDLRACAPQLLDPLRAEAAAPAWRVAPVSAPAATATALSPAPSHLQRGAGVATPLARKDSSVLRNAPTLERASPTSSSTVAFASLLRAALPASVIDVTGPLQALAEFSEGAGEEAGSVAAAGSGIVLLQVPAGSKSRLDCFWDPCDGFPKQLLVRYAFLGRLHQAIVEDEAGLRCPQRRHLVKGALSPRLARLRGGAGASSSSLLGSPALRDVPPQTYAPSPAVTTRRPAATAARRRQQTAARPAPMPATVGEEPLGETGSGGGDGESFSARLDAASAAAEAQVPPPPPRWPLVVAAAALCVAAGVVYAGEGGRVAFRAAAGRCYAKAVGAVVAVSRVV